jgi:hypothetical protein
LTRAVDTLMPSRFNPEEVSLVLELGLLCSHPLPNARPTMRQVTQYLDCDMPLPDLSQTYTTSFVMMEWMYSREFDHNLMPCVSSSLTSVGAISLISRVEDDEVVVGACNC